MTKLTVDINVIKHGRNRLISAVETNEVKTFILERESISRGEGEGERI